MFGDDFNFTETELRDFNLSFEEFSDEENRALERLHKELTDKLPDSLQFKKNAGINVGTYNTSKLWEITDKSDMIFLSHLSEHPIQVFENLQNSIVHSILTTKGGFDDDAE